MRLVTFLITFSFISQLSAQKKPVDVYLIGGQSNATGQGYVVNIPEDFTVDTAVLFFYSCSLDGIPGIITTMSLTLGRKL